MLFPGCRKNSANYTDFAQNSFLLLKIAAEETVIRYIHVNHISEILIFEFSGPILYCNLFCISLFW